MNLTSRWKIFYEWMSNTGFNGEIWVVKMNGKIMGDVVKWVRRPYIENDNAFTAKWIDDGFAIRCSNW